MIWVLLAAAAQAGAATPPQPLQAIAATITGDDYPAEAMRNGAQGTVGFTVAVDATGQVTGCTIDAGSNDASLDRATCDIVRQRAHFRAARDSAGRAVAGRFSATLAWRLREETSPFPIGEFIARTVLHVSRAGEARCTVTIAGRVVPMGDGAACGHLAGTAAAAALRGMHREAELVYVLEVLRADMHNSPPPAGRLLEEHEATFGIDREGRPVDCRATIDRVVRPLADLGRLPALCDYRPPTANRGFAIIPGQTGVRPERIHAMLTLVTDQAPPLR
jgi:protein TonB